MAILCGMGGDPSLTHTGGGYFTQCIKDATKSEKIVFEAITMNEDIYRDPEVFELRDINLMQQYGKATIQGVRTL